MHDDVLPQLRDVINHVVSVCAAGADDRELATQIVTGLTRIAAIEHCKAKRGGWFQTWSGVMDNYKNGNVTHITALAVEYSYLKSFDSILTSHNPQPLNSNKFNRNTDPKQTDPKRIAEMAIDVATNPSAFDGIGDSKGYDDNKSGKQDGGSKRKGNNGGGDSKEGRKESEQYYYSVKTMFCALEAARLNPKATKNIEKLVENGMNS